MTRRPGVTLMEVLVAIMIMGVGLLALLTLFPLGAMEMVQSVKDDRVGLTKVNARAIFTATGMGADTYLRDNGMLNPGGGIPPGSGIPAGGQILPALNNPADPNYFSYQDSISYPVFVDPIGWAANAGNPAWQHWVGGQVGLGPRRMTMKELDPSRSPDPVFMGAPPLPPGVLSVAQYQKMQLYRWNVFLDDIYFPRDDELNSGKPCPPPPPAGTSLYERTPRYSWAYLLQMPKVRLSNVVDLTVVVYGNRQLDEPMNGETLFAATFNPGASTITLQWAAGQAPPDVAVGGWVMDGSMLPTPQGRFYRVVGITQTSATTMDIEVLNTLRRSGNGQVFIMDNVIEVFEKVEF